MEIAHFLDRTTSRLDLSVAELQAIFDAMLVGSLTDAQTAAFLVAWKVNGERADHFVAGARSMRQAAIVPAIAMDQRPLLDTCGTGGDQSGSFNISTASAIVTASAGVLVAKHGNRSISSQCGSADLMFELGFPESLGPSAAAALLRETGFTFFFAPNFHPGMKYVMPVRRSLGIRTVFNLLGPLANPILPEYQVIGIGSRQYLDDYAQAALELGIKNGLVVHSRDGMDEISCAVPTDAIWIHQGKRTPMLIDPVSLGCSGKPLDHGGGDAKRNKELLLELFAGRGAPVENAVVLNSGAGLWISGKVSSMEEGVLRARELIRNGYARSFLEKVIGTAQRLAAN